MVMQPDYRGVSKSTLIDSLKRAEAFINGLNLGPATAQDMREWAAGKPYEKIAAAKTRVELAQVMKETGSAHQFLIFRPLFEQYALADARGSGDRKRFQDMAAWGGFSGAHTLSYTPQNEEIDAHITHRLVAIAGTPKAQTMLAAVMHELAKTEMAGDDNQKRMAKDLLDMGGRVSAVIGNHGDINQLFKDGSLRERYLLLQVLRAMSGLEQNRVNLKAEGPFGRYGVVLAEGRGQGFEKLMALAQPVMPMVSAALEPFYETDEVQMTAVGSITRDHEKAGLIFTTTRAGAMAVAAAVPGYVVIDYTGRPVQPPASKGPAAPQP